MDDQDVAGPMRIEAVRRGAVLSVAAGDIDGRPLIVSSGRDGTVRRWDTDTGDRIGDPLSGHNGPVWAVAFGRVGGRRVIVSAGADGTVRRWDASTGSPLGEPLLGHTGPVRQVALGEGGEGRRLIVSADEDGAIRRWDAATGDSIGEPLTEHTGPVSSVAVGQIGDRSMIVIGGYDGTLRRWDTDTDRQIGEPRMLHTGRVSVVAMGAVDGRPLIVSAGSDGTVRRWDAGTGDPIGEPLVGHTGPVLSLALGPVDGQPVILSAGSDGTVRRWDATTGSPIGEPLTGHAGVVFWVALGRIDARPVIISAGSDGTLRRWDAPSGSPIGEPLTGHAGPVWSVAVGRVNDNTVIVSGGDDAMVHRWDASTGNSFGDELLDHPLPVLAVACGQLRGRPVIVSTGDDATVRRWDAGTGGPIGEPLTGHTGPVPAVAVGQVGDQTVIVSAGDDGTLRRWDASNGNPIGEILTGHTSPVWAVALGLVGERPVIISAGPDGDVRRWDATSGDPIGEPLPAHVWSVALGQVGDRAVIVSAGDNGTVGRWDAGTGEPIGEPLTGHSGRVLSVALGQVGDRQVIVSAGDDRTVRRWDATTGDPIGEPLTGHTGRVLSVAVGQVEDQQIIVSASEAGVLLVWPADFGIEADADAGASDALTSESTTSQDTAPPAAAPPGFRTESLAATDTLSGRDSLGREILAAHLDGLLNQLATAHDESAPVVHIDGRWGSGKSKLVELLLREDAERKLAPPVVVRYDAWRESAVAPEWWSVAAAINREVHRRRAFAARIAMTLSGAAQRIARAPAVLVAGALLVAVLIARGLGLWSDAGALGNVLTTLAAVAAIGLAAGRALFWSSPILGRLHQQADDNPLGEIAALVGRLRRWSPRDEDRQHGADNVLGLWFLAGGVTIVGLLSARLAGLSPEAAVLAWAVEHAVALAIAVAAAFVLIGIPAHTRFTRRLLAMPRRPILLVVDDVDRCAADRVVKLIEIIHTLLRERAGPNRMRKWRRPAPLMVLVLADGRWLRAAFESTFDTFASLGSAVHPLGADFLQKVFDHSVLVPALSADQLQGYVNAVSGSAQAEHPAPTTGEHLATRTSEGADLPPTPAVRPTPQQVRQWIDVGRPGSLDTERIDNALRRLPEEFRVPLAAAKAAKDASGEAVSTVSRHLLANYASLMPANPRLVKRVANCFGMLKALRDTTRHTEELDTIVRAAVMFVRFPALVDELLSAADPPVTDRSEIGAGDSVWGRRDVQQVLGHVDIEAIARCFGREFPLSPITMIVLPDGPAERRPSTRTPLQPAGPSELSP